MRLAWVQLGVLAALLLVLPAGKQVDPDFWWHLRTGELIFHAGIPRHDVFSWTAGGNNWVAHEWLSEVIIYAAESVFGYVGNMVVFGAAMLASLGLMIHFARRQGVGTRALVLLTAVSVLMLGSFFTVRPQVFTWLLFAVFVYIVLRHEAGERVHLWILPALMALWANLHLGFVYGLAVLSLWLGSLVVYRMAGRNVELRAPAIAVGACIPAACLNPRGPALLWYPLSYLFTGATDRALVQEWQRPDLLAPSTLPLLVGAAILIVAVLVRQRPRLLSIALAVFALGLSADAVRNVPFVAIVLIPVAGPTLAARWRAASKASDSEASVRLPYALGLVVAAAAGFWFLSAFTTGAWSFWQPSQEGYPSSGAAYVRQHLEGRRIFNEYAWGGFLEYELYPGTLAFIDGRADFYGGRMLRDYVTIDRAEPGWDSLLDRYGVEVVMASRAHALSGALRRQPGWREVFVGNEETIFVRSEPQDSSGSAQGQSAAR